MITFAQLGRYGRLGNQMFQIASVIGIAKRFGYQFAFPYWKNYDHLERFGTSEDIDIQKYFLNPLPFTDDPTKFPDYAIPWGLHLGYIPDNVSISGHMQSERYFKHCENDIRHYFRFRDPYPQNGFCAIHVRLGDYDDNYHPRLKQDYYAKAIAQFPNEPLLLFSDDVPAAKEMILSIDPKLKERLHYSDSNNYIEDFKFMSACKNFIIGNSTYSWWGAWLGVHPEKKVVAPREWFGPAWGSQYKTMAEDIYAENWIVL